MTRNITYASIAILVYLLYRIKHKILYFYIWFATKLFLKGSFREVFCRKDFHTKGFEGHAKRELLTKVYTELW